jgi:hypothetical protein
MTLFSCQGEQMEKPLENILYSSEEEAIRRVVDNIDRHELQILYTQIDRTNGQIQLVDHKFGVNDSAYFYPASTVKFPIALLALEEISQREDFSLDTRFYVEGDTLETTVREEVIKVFATSDNDANNRLFEFLGQDAINEGLAHKNVGPIRISHRLSTENADDITTRPLIVYLNDSTITQMGPVVNAPLEHLKLKNISKGIGFITEDELIEEPFDFSLKNYYPLSTQQEVMKRLIFPERYGSAEYFDLGQEERTLMLDAMSSPPRKWGYDEVEYYDSYGKFFIYGDSMSRIPESVKIFNKVGYAYGTLTDCAYVKDSRNDIEFILTATILVNQDGVFNDDQYEYESIGIPFLAALGREIHKYELKRK